MPQLHVGNKLWGRAGIILLAGGIGAYASWALPRAHAESTEPATAFSKFGPTSLLVQNVQVVNHNTKRLVLQFADPRARSGLHPTASLLTITYPGGRWLPLLRPYTPISDLEKPGQIELMVKQYPNGRGSGYIHSLKPGDHLTVLAPLKGFQWKNNQFPHVYLLAGGAGITPIYQLMRNILKDPTDKTKLTLLFGVNTEEDLLLRDELEDFARRFPGRFQYTCTISHPKKQDSAFRTGRIDENLLREVVVGSDRNTMVFVSGPPAMETALVGSKRGSGILQQLGFTKDQIHTF